jgi:hypothetical protein
MRRILRRLADIVGKLDEMTEKLALIERDLMNLRYKDSAGVRLDSILARHFIVLPKPDPKTRLYDREAIGRTLDELPGPMKVSDFTRTELFDLLTKVGRLTA